MFRVKKGLNITNIIISVIIVVVVVIIIIVIIIITLIIIIIDIGRVNSNYITTTITINIIHLTHGPHITFIIIVIGRLHVHLGNSLLKPARVEPSPRQQPVRPVDVRAVAVLRADVGDGREL